MVDKICTFLVLLLLLLPAGAFPQEGDRRITGEVRDAEGVPLVGVAVRVKQSMTGVVTDSAGRYEIRVDSPDAMLVFSYLGMKEVEARVGQRTQIDVMMEVENNRLDEVVCIAYGSVKKSDLTGSVSSIRGEDIENRNVVSLEDALRGRIPGVTILSSDGQPGQTLSMRIRGVGSINASNEPLYVIDGVPVDEVMISPGEVASMEILKDASATAIYGSRGANGVVLITTRQGSQGKPRINVQYRAGYNTPVRLYEMMNNWQYSHHRSFSQYAVYRNGEGYVPANKVQYLDRYGNVWAFFNNKFLAWQDIRDGVDTVTPNTDWQDLMLRPTFTHDARLSISGGGESNTYSIMASYYDDEGTVVNSDYNRFTLRTNFIQNILHNLKLTTNFSAGHSLQRGAMTAEMNGTLMRMLGQMPTKAANFTEEIVAEEGETDAVNNNPWYLATKAYRGLAVSNVLGRAELQWDFAKDFMFKISGSYDYRLNVKDDFTPNDILAGKDTNGKVSNLSTHTQNWMSEALLYWQPASFGNHKVDVMAGFSATENNSRVVYSSTENFIFQDFGQNGMNFGLTPIYSTDDRVRTRLASFIGRVNYSYKSKYLFTATFRADGSSRFGKGNKWAYFPSAAFAWNACHEPFFQDIRWLSNFKIRTSAGISGNTAISGYQTLPLLGAVNTAMNNQAVDFGMQLQRVATPELKWETSIQYDAGVDLGFLNNRITSTVDLYYKQTRDLLMSEQIPSYTGYTTRWSNSGAVDNYGLEILVNADIFRRANFSWISSFNISFNRSKVVDLGESTEMVLSSTGLPVTNYAIMREGYPLGMWYGYQIEGLYRSFEEIDRLPDNYKSIGGLQKPPQSGEIDVQSYITPGRYKYVDQNGDNVIDESDRVMLGCAQPDFVGGFQNTFTYKNFSLLVGLEFSYGREVFNATRLNVEEAKGVNNQTLRFYENTWRPDLYDMTTGELAIAGNETDSWLHALNYSTTATDNYINNLYVEDGSYLRISDIVLTYTLPRKIVQKLRLSSLKFSLGVNNAFLFTKYSGYDPDVNTVMGAMADLIPGVDNGSYPRSRTYLVSMNLTF